MFNGSNCCEDSRVQNVAGLVQFADRRSEELSVSVFTPVTVKKTAQTPV